MDDPHTELMKAVVGVHSFRFQAVTQKLDVVSLSFSF